MLPRHARCVLSCLHCNRHSFLLSSYLFIIGRIKNPCCSTCRQLSQGTSNLILYRLYAPLALGLLSVFARPLAQALGSCLASGAPWSSAMHPFFGRGWVATIITVSARVANCSKLSSLLIFDCFFFKPWSFHIISQPFFKN